MKPGAHTLVFGGTRTFEPPEEFQDSRWELRALWKIRVRPVPGADWERKRVGVICELEHSCRPGAETYLATYFATLADGTEEWHVARRWEGVPAAASGQPCESRTFVVWYQDGLGHTYYDDNDGRLYRLVWPGGRLV
jgi:hypothetical protein